MNFKRIKALWMQEYFITTHSTEVFFDTIILPLASLIVFGYLANFLAGSAGQNVSNSILSGMLLWQIVFIIQYTVSTTSLWNIWFKNLTNIFIAPISTGEYLMAQFLSALVKAIILFSLSCVFVFEVFHFNIFQFGVINISLFFINLGLFSLSLGTVILGLIFRYGTRVQSFAWGFLPLVQPITAAFYPVSILPVWLQYISRLLPPTYIFEAARDSLLTHAVRWDLIGISFGINCIYFMLALWFFISKYRQSMMSGQFARLDG